MAAVIKISCDGCGKKSPVSFKIRDVRQKLSEQHWAFLEKGNGDFFYYCPDCKGSALGNNAGGNTAEQSGSCAIDQIGHMKVALLNLGQKIDELSNNFDRMKTFIDGTIPEKFLEVATRLYSLELQQEFPKKSQQETQETSTEKKGK